MLKLIVNSIENPTDRIRYFTLSGADDLRLPGFTAGAHLEFRIDENTTRAYSLIDFSASTEQPTHYRIAVQLEADSQGGSRYMHQLAVGDRLTASEPKNSFALEAGNQSVVLLAGGIGITPLISMASELQRRGVDFHLHYSGRNTEAMAFADRLVAIFGARVTLYQDDIDARKLNLSQLIDAIDSDQHLYLCGPKGMIDATKTLAENAGINMERVHIELFESIATQSSDVAFEVELQQTGQVFVVPPGQSIIDVLEAAGIDLIYDCQRGDCGICQTQVISGEIDHRDVVLSSAERASGEVMQICVSRAKSPRLVLDL